MLFVNLAAACAMVTATVLMHFWGLATLTRVVSGGGARLKAHEDQGRGALLLLVSVFGVFALHTAEIWSYATLYRLLGETRSFEEALYFSTVTFASLGYGDIVLSPPLAAPERDRSRQRRHSLRLVDRVPADGVAPPQRIRTRMAEALGACARSRRRRPLGDTRRKGAAHGSGQEQGRSGDRRG